MRVHTKQTGVNRTDHRIVIGDAGVGFAVRPGYADDWQFDAAGAAQLAPGGYPVDVRLLPTNEMLRVLGPGAIILAPRPGLGHLAFRELEIVTYQPRRAFQVTVFEARDEQHNPSPVPQQTIVPLLKTATAVTQLSPAVDDTSAWEVLPGQTGWQLAFSGAGAVAGTTVRPWGKNPASNVWTDYGSGSQIDLGTDLTVFLAVKAANAFRAVGSTGAVDAGKLQIVASAPNVFVTVDRVMEIF